MKIVLQRREQAKSLYNHRRSDVKKEIPDTMRPALETKNVFQLTTPEGDVLPCATA